MNPNTFTEKVYKKLPMTGSEMRFYKTCRGIAGDIILHSKNLDFDDVLYNVIVSNLDNIPMPILKNKDDKTYDLLGTMQNTDSLFSLVILPNSYFKKVTNNE